MLDGDLPSHFERTPAAVAFMEQWQAGRIDAALDVLEPHWLELWYAFDPTDLRTVLEKIPAGHLAAPGLRHLMALTGASVTGLVPPRRRGAPETPGERVGLTAHRAGELRVQGRAQSAVDLLRRGEPDMRALQGALVDTTGGAATMWSLQAGISALLAGDLPAARNWLLRATSPHRPARFPFVARDAALKLALTHAVAGDMVSARQWCDRATAIARTDSWVEALLDDTAWLVDYICCVEALELDRAEEMRVSKPFPLGHLEFWGVGLQAQVRHLVLTGRAARAAEVCDEVAAAGMPQAEADGWQAVILDEARLMCRPIGSPRSDEAPATDPRVAVARRRDLLAVSMTGELNEPHPSEDLDTRGDVRAALALRLLRAQGLVWSDRGEEGWPLLLGTLDEILERGLLTQLIHLSRRTLDLVPDSPVAGDPIIGRVVTLVETHALPLIDVVEHLDADLTPAEVSVLRLLRQGRTRQEMAADLFLSLNTVKTQLSSAYRKLQVSSRAEAVVKAERLGL